MKKKLMADALGKTVTRRDKRLKIGSGGVEKKNGGKMIKAVGTTRQQEEVQPVTPSCSGQKGGAKTASVSSLVHSKSSPGAQRPRSTMQAAESPSTPSSSVQKGGTMTISKKNAKKRVEEGDTSSPFASMEGKSPKSPVDVVLKAKKSSGMIGKRRISGEKKKKMMMSSEKKKETAETTSHKTTGESIDSQSNADIGEDLPKTSSGSSHNPHEVSSLSASLNSPKGGSLKATSKNQAEEAIRAQLLQLSARRKAVERGEMKENESSPILSSTVSTPKLKNMNSAMRDSASSPAVSASSTGTTLQSKKKKEGKGGVESADKTDKMRAALTSIRRKSLEERLEGCAGDDDWPIMKAFVPVKNEGHEERQRLKKETKMKKKKKKKPIVMERSTTEVEVTVPKPTEPDTVPVPSHPSPMIGTGSKNARPTMTASMDGKMYSLPKHKLHRRPHPISPLPSNGTVPSLTSDTVSKQESPTTTVHAKPSPTLPYPNGIRTSPSNPKHIRFASESPVKCPPPSSPTKPSIDTGTVPRPAPSTVTEVKTPTGSPTPAAAAAVGETRMNGRVKRDSSPEVSTTSSESSGDEKSTKKEEERRKKRLTKKPEVTSPTVTPSKTSISSVTSSTPVVSPKTKSPEKSHKQVVQKEEIKKKRKSKLEDENKDTVTVPVVEKKEEEEEDEERLRPSSDVLQMVAAKLVNSHGILVFRLISRETHRIAKQQLRNADETLHLEEFDDENAFTRDDMTQWWEERREAEDNTVRAGKKNRSHVHVSKYLNMRSVEKRLLKDMDGGMSHPSSAASAVDHLELLQHPLATLDAACLLHESQTAAAARLMQQEGENMKEVWLGHCNAKLVREVKRLKSLELFEHRQATMETLEKLPMLQMMDLRLDIVDDDVTRAGVGDRLVNGLNLRVLQLNIAPSGPLDGNTASHYNLFTKRSYDRTDYTDDLEWMIPNVEDGEPDPVTLCMPSLEHLATNVANVKLFWQLRDTTLLLRHLLSLRVGTLSRTRELISCSELFADTKESRKYKQPGFFSLRDAYETVLESVTLRLADRVGVCRLQRETATLFEAIGELPPSLRRLSISLFYNQFSGVCAPFRKWAEPEVEAPDTDHIGISEMHLQFERAFDLRGLPALLPRAIKKLSIAVNYDNEEDAKCLGPFIEMLPGLERLECLEDLHIQVWGVRCLQPLVASVAACSNLAARLTRLAVAAYPVDDAFFEGDAFPSWLRSSLSSFPRIRTIGLHAAVLVRMVPKERRSGYSWRNGLAWLANEVLSGRQIEAEKAPRLEEIELAAAEALPILDDGEDYTITPHWEVEYNTADLVLSPEDEEVNEELEDASYSIPRGDEGSDEDDDFITDGEDEEDHAGDASRDDLERMEEGLEDETEKIERREMRRDEKVRAAIERGEMKEGEEEEEGDLIDFDSISDEEEEATQPKNEFFDDEAVESDREESGDEDKEKLEESADSDCSSDDDEKEREEERMKEEGRRQKRMQRKQAKLDDEVDRRKRKRALESDDDEDDGMTIVIRRPINKKKKVIIESDDE